MGSRKRSPEEQARREKIRELLQLSNVSSMEDIQTLFKETIAEFMEDGLDAELTEELGYSSHLWGVYTKYGTAPYSPPKGTYTDTPKSDRSSRVLRVSRAAILILQEYQQWQDAQREKLGDAWKNEDDRVFTNDFGRPLHPGSPQQWFRQFIQRTGLPYVTLHGLRHTYASLMIFDSTPIATISKRLGHAQTSTTQNIYIHAIAAADARAEKTFDRFDEVILADKHQTNTKKKKRSHAGKVRTTRIAGGLSL